MENDSALVRCFDGGDHAEGAAFGRVIGGVEDVLESGFYVGGGDRTTVVETNAGAEMEYVGEWVRKFPGFREVAVEIHLVVALEEAAEEQAVDVLRLRVSGETWIEVGGIGFEEEGEGGGICVAWSGAGMQEER